VASIGKNLTDTMGKHIYGIEGLKDSEWVCADLGDIVVHIFVPEKRALYNLEKLWGHIFPEN
jgi:ribosome-associated protein